MAKKKAKIVSNRGYATTSAPSKQIPTKPAEDQEVENATIEIPKPDPFSNNKRKNQKEAIKKENGDPVLNLLEKYKTLNERKSQVLFDKLSKEDIQTQQLPEERIKKFSLTNDVEADLLKIITNKQTDLFAVEPSDYPVIKNEADKEKTVSQLDILYKTLLKLGFHIEDVNESFKSIMSLSIENYLDWLCINVPYERMPIGFFGKYYNDDDDGNQITLLANNSSDTKQTAEIVENKAEDITIKKEKKEKEPDNNNDMKARILQAAQQYMDDEEEQDIHEQYAKIKIELLSLEKLVQPNNNDNNKIKKKNKKNFVEEETKVELSNDEIAKVKKNIKSLKDKLSSLEADWDFNKNTAEQVYQSHLQAYNDEKRKQQIDAREQLKNKKLEDEQKKDTVDMSEDDDEGGLFGGLIGEEDDNNVSTLAEPAVLIQWNIIEIDIPKSFTGRYPKDLLLDYCNKKKLGKQSFNSSKVSSNVWRSSVKIAKTGSNNDYLQFELPSDMGTSNRQDSEQLIALYALFDLDPDSSMYKVLANSYKDIWLGLLDEKKQREEGPQLKADKERLSFLIGLVDKSTKEIGHENNVSDSENISQASSNIIVEESKNKVLKQHKLFTKMQEKFSERLSTESYLEMKAKRDTLPITAFRSEVLGLLSNNQVLILSGETGCGKSTQVPQFIAEDLLLNSKNGGFVICTQPRRISAMSIANRVSTEMGDRPKSTGSRDAMVGYQIRLESKSSPENVLLFCTTGILLRKLENDKELEGVTHIVVDEVHERTIESDFLLIILKRLLSIRTDLKVILMSATVEASRFSNYFGNCPVISVPGRTFPVHVQYLEDIIEETDYTLEEDSPYAVRRTKKRKDQGNISVSGQHGSSKRVHYEIFEEDSDDEDPYDPTLIHSKLTTVDYNSDNEEIQVQSSIVKKYSRHTRKMVKRIDENKINYDLILELLDYICNNKKSTLESPTIPDTGAILVFLPGINEIRKLFDVVSSHNVFGDPTKYSLIALHSTLSSEQQEKAFEIPEEGIRKIVFSTNIAETGVTISDVTVVIDTGMARVVSYDEKRRVSRLLQKYVAKANARQRRGRAGRVQEGVCFHLFSQKKYEEMADYETPEILRLPLEELCLRIKVCGLGGIRQVLNECLDSPSEKMVNNAILTLQEVQALSIDGNETLTPLGVHLSNLPVDVHIGKMILFGALFRCLDPILTIAAALSFKSPFIRPFGKEDEADTARQRFKSDESDFLTIYNGYDAWRKQLIKLQTDGSSSGSTFRKIRTFCKQQFLSEKNLEMIEDMKRQYLGLLVSIGFVKADGQFKSFSQDVKRSSIKLCQIPNSYDMYSHSIPLINAALTAGLYPKAAEYLPKSKQIINKDLELQIHPSSVLYQKHLKAQTDFLVYNTVVMNSSGNQSKDRVFMWEATWIDPVAIILLATNNEIKHKQRKIVLDNWIYFDCFARTGVLLKFLRKELNNWLTEKMKKPDLDLSQHNEEVMNVLVKTLETNSFLKAK